MTLNTVENVTGVAHNACTETRVNKTKYTTVRGPVVQCVGLIEMDSLYCIVSCMNIEVDGNGNKH